MDFDDDFYDDYDLDYFYVEDSYDIADDLAEHACPSPPPGYDDDYDWDEHSRFDYWVDIEYDSDGYDDIVRRKQPKRSSSPTKVKIGQKRKASVALTAKDKRRKLLGDSTYLKTIADSEDKRHGTVVWRTTEEKLRDPSNSTMAAGLDAPNPVALLKDWKERFADDSGFETGAADENDWNVVSDTDEVSPKSKNHVDGDDLNSLLAASGLDAEALKAALEANLAAAGAAPGVDADTLLKYAARMLGSGDDSDDIAGQLAEELLGGEGDGEDDGAFIDWVQRQKNQSQPQEESRKDSATDIDDMDAPPSRAKEIEDEVTAHVHGHETREAEKEIMDANEAAVQRNLEIVMQPLEKKRKCADLLGQDLPRKKEKKGYEMPTMTSSAKASAVPIAAKQAKVGGKK